MLAIQEYFPGSIVDFKQQNDIYTVVCDNDCHIQLTVVTPSILRVRYAPDGHFEPDFSYGISNKFEASAGHHHVSYETKEIIIHTAAMDVVIKRKDANISFKNKKGLVINTDEKGFHWEEHEKYGGNIVKMSKTVQSGEAYYGLGDKPMHLNLRGKRLVNWGSDVYGFQKDQDPLYKNIPFFLGLHNKVAYGIFFDNSFKSQFDFASERKSVTSFWADGGEMNYYFIYGPELIDVSAQYTLLSGVPDLPPLWALGYHQCKWSYYPEAQVREITDTFRSLQLPCDAIYLDIDYMDGFRCFTWDKDKFPDPANMISDFKDKGFKTIVIIDPGIKVDPDYHVFKDGIDKDMFCRRADGPYMKGKVWPGDCYFPDFTNPKVRKWWAELFESLIGDMGVDGVWNDMNEPALFEVASKTFPDDVRHDYDGNPCSHRKAHNVYGMQMARATYKGIKKYTKADNRRPFVITRSAYSGAQRYTSGWTGDNIASWEHLWVANVQVQRLAASGFSFCGSDVGGFTEHPTPELYVRWIQLATFHPFFRTHSSGDHGLQEPWTFGDMALSIVRQYLEWRYQLLPYIYTAFYQYVTYGYPMIRSLAMLDQADYETHNRVDEFMLGDHMLICPILESNSNGRYMYLPKGNWYDYWTDEAHKGGKEFWTAASLETIPVFIKAGSVIPNYPVQQYVGEQVIEVVSLHIYPVEEGEYIISMLYEDSGDGYDNEKGIYNLKTFSVHKKEGKLFVVQNRKGHFDPTYDRYEIILHGLESLPTSIQVNEKPLDASQWDSNEKGQVVFMVDRRFLDIQILF